MKYKNKNFDWSPFINELAELPDFSNLWETDFSRNISLILSPDKNKKILEVGCSNGRWLKWFNREYGYDVYGIDNNQIGFKEEKIINFKLGDGKDIPFSDEYFDIVFSLGLIEHFEKKEKFQLLKEQYRVLKKSGILICQVPMLSFSLNFIYTKLFYDFKKGFLHYRTTKEEIENYFKKIGISIVFSDTIGNLLESFIKNKKITNFFNNKKILSTEILIIGKKI